MTNEELTAIEKRANAATMGPWEGTKNSGVVSKHDAYDTVFETGCGCCTDKDLSAEDAAFIAAARVDVPALIAEVRKLRAERDALRKDAAIIFALREPSEIVVDAMREHIYNYAVTSTQDLRYALRAALTAALAVQPSTGDAK